MKKLLLLIGFASLTINAQVPTYVPTNGLVGWYPFNGNANDFSTNSNNLTNNNNVTYGTDRFSQNSSAAVFNGVNQTLSKANPSLFNGNSSRTISFWFNQANIFTGGDCSVFNIFNGPGGTGECNSSSSIIVSGNPNSNFLFWGRCNDRAWSSPRVLNTWYHVVLTYSDNQLNLYVNNNLLPSPSILTNPLNTIATNLIIGGGLSDNQDNAFWNGKIDDIGIWNRALTQVEISNLYNANQCFNNITVTDTLIINVGQLSFSNPISYANNITIAPNPASSQINVDFNNITNLNGGSLKVINSLGQEVATTPITTSGTQSIMQLATWGGAGMYFVQIINPQGQIVDIKKIILQ